MTQAAQNSKPRGGRARLRLVQTFWCVSAAVLLVASACLTVSGLDRQFPPPLGSASDVSTVVVDRSGQLLRAFTVADGRWRLPVKLDEVDTRFVDMLIAYEDKRFHSHNGLDPLAMMRSALQLVRNGRIVSGGSTLSMQLARLLEPRKKRSFSAKLHQMVRAIQIERRLSKRQILEHYLTLAPYGGNLEGIRAAALAYFNKSPARLSVAEAALLIALPQLPEARRPDRRPNAAFKARNRVLQRMVDAGVLPALDGELAAARPVPRTRQSMPALAAHLSERLRSSRPHTLVHRVTLDRTIQAGLEVLVERRVRKLGPKLSIAILVADAHSGEVIARVGSADYLSHDRQGALDMTRATRSPGSTLKSFIYGLAFDAGLARPATLIDDAPADFNGYAPANFDLSYQGTVTVRKALQKSLNVPAVSMLEGVGPLRLMSLFNRAGVRAVLPRDKTPSLAIALGGIGMRLEDLMTLYTAFPNLGSARELTDLPRAPDQQRSEPVRLLGQQASWYVNSILSGTPPPDHAAASGIAFKTGTSYGYRDAWAVGYDGTHVMGVWVGRPDGASVPGLTGRSAAAPILFEGFTRITTARAPLPAAPAGTRLAQNADLPAGLRHFTRGTQLAGRIAGSQPDPAISYPPNGAKVELSSVADDRHRPLFLKVNGGSAPFSWFVNGAPVDTRNRRRHSTWTPDGLGFSTLTVIDAQGRSDRVTVFLK